MKQCKKCFHTCHCKNDLHADEYGVCTCDECVCKQRKCFCEKLLGRKVWNFWIKCCRMLKGKFQS